MKKLHVMCLAYNTFELVKDTLTLFELQRPDYKIESATLVDVRYPNDPAINPASLKELADLYGWNYVRPAKNYGCAGGWNWLIRELNLGDGDVLWGADPDGRPQEPKYLDAVMEIFNKAPEAYTVQLNRPCVYSQNLPRFERKIGNVNVIDYHQLVAWSLGAFDCGWLRKIGGMLQRHPLYGYTEHATSAAAGALGGKWYITKDFYDVHLKAPDPAFVEWKLACAEYRTQATFDQWLKEREPK
jgi:hypothetical protein